MKKVFTIMIVLLSVLLCLSGCTAQKKEEEVEVKGETYDLGGKTYYNTVDEYGHDDHSKVWFGKDGSFVFNDSYSEGYYEIDGTWSLNEDVLTLNVDKTGQGSFSKVIFEVKDIDTLSLKTTLAGSKSDHIFSTTEVKGSTAKTDTETKTDNSGKTDGDSKSDGKSEGDSGSSEASAPKDIPCTGITSLYKNYWSYEGVKGWDLEIRPVPADTTDKMTFKSNDESVVKIDDQGRATAVGVGKTTIDVTCGSKKLTVNYEVRVKGVSATASTWWSENPNAAKGCEPHVYFDGAGNFIFTENLFSGMGTYKGTYVIEDGRYYCTVKEMKEDHGHLPEVDEIIFKIVDDKTLKLKTSLQMSQPGELFYLGS
ncbi:MAG: Ig-like domain-containing protein [Erysipelotrichaceae bacterium]|nr:Ig-like domain-containing protein [Erysipelotrichaceae bacterium]